LYWNVRSGPSSRHRAAVGTRVRTAFHTCEEDSMNATLEARELNATHRCDACGAQAYVRVVLESTGGELLFCAHHARVNEDKLRPLAASWQDETERIGA